MASKKYSTHQYQKFTDGTALTFDFYPPATSQTGRVPSILYFHGGGLVIGDARSFFPTWLQERAARQGWAFISAEYRLLLPVETAHDILEDVNNALSFIRENPEVTHTDPTTGKTEAFVLDPDHIAVAGSSAGGWLACLAAAHSRATSSRVPKAVVSIYGMGGDLLHKSFITPKTEPFWFGQPLLNLEEHKGYFHPVDPNLIKPSVGQGIEMSAAPPKEGRHLLVPLFMQTGNRLDYDTGNHEPSLSVTLRNIWSEFESSPDLQERLRNAIPQPHRVLFPDFVIPDATWWPPTLTIHGNADTFVPVEGSRNIARLAREKGAEVVSIELEGENHGFDLGPTVEEKYGKRFDEVVEFLQKWL